MPAAAFAPASRSNFASGHVITRPRIVGAPSATTRQKEGTSGGSPARQDLVEIVHRQQFQSTGGNCGGHIVDGVRALAMNLDLDAS